MNLALIFKQINLSRITHQKILKIIAAHLKHLSNRCKFTIQWCIGDLTIKTGWGKEKNNDLDAAMIRKSSLCNLHRIHVEYRPK